jgi:glutamine amidotransferase PdxT
MCFQIQSFEAELSVPELASKEGGPETFRGVFIRAPAILEVGPEVQVLADYPVPSNKVLFSNSAVEMQEVCYMLISIRFFTGHTLKEKFSAIQYIN